MYYYFWITESKQKEHVLKMLCEQYFHKKRGSQLKQKKTTKVCCLLFNNFGDMWSVFMELRSKQKLFCSLLMLGITSHTLVY